MVLDTQRRIFEPFFTTKRSGEGTGMGLTIVKRTIKQHDGTINVESYVDVGTIFTIDLPIKTKSIAANPKHPKSPRIEQDCPKPLHIMIVDDERVLLNTTSEMLRMLGHRVTTCQTGKEALEKYERIWRSVDIVILDMIMPEMDGRQVYSSLRQINPSVNVLVTSGFVEDDQYDELLNRGIKGILRKPFHLENLSDKIVEVYNEIERAQ